MAKKKVTKKKASKKKTSKKKAPKVAPPSLDEALSMVDVSSEFDSNEDDLFKIE